MTSNAIWDHSLKARSLAILADISALFLEECRRNSFRPNASGIQALHAVGTRKLPDVIWTTVNAGVWKYLKGRLACRDAAVNIRSSDAWAKSTVETAAEMLMAVAHCADAGYRIGELSRAIESGAQTETRQLFREVLGRILLHQRESGTNTDAQLAFQEASDLLGQAAEVLGITLDRAAAEAAAQRGELPANTVVDRGATHGTDIDPERSFFPQELGPGAAAAGGNADALRQQRSARG